MRQFEAEMEQTAHFRLEDRRERVCDMRASMADKEGFTEYLNGLKPKR